MQLPIAEARERMGLVGDADVHAERSQRLSIAAKQLNSQRLVMNLRLVQAVEGAWSDERRLVAERHGAFRRSRSTVPAAAGYILCERMVMHDTPNGPYEYDYTVGGLLLDRRGNVHAYRTTLPQTESRLGANAVTRVDEWGGYGRQLQRGSQAQSLAADITTLDFRQRPEELEPIIASVTAPLSLEDMYAGFAVRNKLETAQFEL